MFSLKFTQSRKKIQIQMKNQDVLNVWKTFRNNNNVDVNKTFSEHIFVKKYSKDGKCPCLPKNDM